MKMLQDNHTNDGKSDENEQSVNNNEMSPAAPKLERNGSQESQSSPGAVVFCMVRCTLRIFLVSLCRFIKFVL